jgi:hypothetical protein
LGGSPLGGFQTPSRGEIFLTLRLHLPDVFEQDVKYLPMKGPVFFLCLFLQASMKFIK